MKVSRSEQTCALGAAIFGAAAAGAGSVADIQSRVTATREKMYHPIAENHAVYRRAVCTSIARCTMPSAPRSGAASSAT